MRRALLAAALLAGSGCTMQRATTQPLPTRIVFFTEQSTALDATARAVVDETATVAIANPNLPVRVLGFAAPRATNEQIAALSATRAQTVASELQARGVPANRISTSARGATAYSDLAAESRRVEIRFGQ